MARSPSRPVTDAERERVRQLHAQGKGRNAIATELGRSVGTITKIAKALGLSFDRSATVAATEARRADLAARRAAFAVTLQDVAEREVSKMTQPHLYWDWGGKEHDFDTFTAPEPTPADRRAMMLTAGAATDRSLKLSPPKDDNGAEEVGGLLTSLFGQLRARHGDG